MTDTVPNLSGYAKITDIPTSSSLVKSTTVSGTTEEYENIKLWSAADSKIPIAAFGGGCYIIPVTTGGFYWAGIMHDAGHSFMANSALYYCLLR